jgi:hypothetical protein
MLGYELEGRSPGDTYFANGEHKLDKTRQEEKISKALGNEARQGGFGWDEADSGPGGAD